MLCDEALRPQVADRLRGGAPLRRTVEKQMGAGVDVPRDAVESLSGPVPDGAWTALQEYAGLLSLYGRRLSLISARAELEIGRHIVDSASLLSIEPLRMGDGGALEVADLGTGGGLPGVVLAILRPESRFVLVDARRSRVVFLKEAVRSLGLRNVEVVHARLEALRGKREFALAVSRALGSIEETLVPSLRLLSERGRLILFKGPRWGAERERAEALAAGAGCELGWHREVELPGVGRSTRFVEFHVKRAGVRSSQRPPSDAEGPRMP